MNNITITGLGFSMMWRISSFLVLQKGAIIKCGNTKDWKDWSTPRPHYKSHSKHSKSCKELETRGRSRRIAPSSICITLQTFNLILDHTKAKRKLLVLYLWDRVKGMWRYFAVNLQYIDRKTVSFYLLALFHRAQEVSKLSQTAHLSLNPCAHAITDAKYA